MATVSVILPTYNRAHLLPRAVRSVLTQDFVDLELVVVDDGSTDDTEGVVRGLDDGRVRYFRFEHNRGIGAARNEGVRKSSAQLIAFVDSDDVWVEGKLSYQVGVFSRHPTVGLVFGDYLNCNLLTGEKELGFTQARDVLERLRLRALEPELQEVVTGLCEAMLLGSLFATPTVMVRAQVFDEVGSFLVELSGPEDFELWWRAAASGVRFAVTRRCLLERYKDVDSVTSRAVEFSGPLLRAFDICEATARRVGRPELLPALDGARARAWEELVRQHAVAGRRRDAWTAFRRSLALGGSPRLWVYLVAALAGPGAIRAGKAVLGRGTEAEVTPPRT